MTQTLLSTRYNVLYVTLPTSLHLRKDKDFISAKNKIILFAKRISKCYMFIKRYRHILQYNDLIESEKNFAICIVRLYTMHFRSLMIWTSGYNSTKYSFTIYTFSSLRHVNIHCIHMHLP